MGPPALLGWLLVALVAGPAGVDEGPTLAPLVGSESKALVRTGETLLDVAYRHRLGFEAVRRLNPDVDVWIPPPGTVVLLPTEAILPDAPHAGLVINVPEMRLYDYTAPDGPELFSVAVGDAVDPTLLGSFRVGDKRTQPEWNVPESIRLEKPELPAVVPPGPDNPLGSRWMTIGTTSYGIHGTNNLWSIGREATHGCVRLYEDEMQRLYERTRSGTPLHIVYQPSKWGSDGTRLYLEAHPDLYGREGDRLAAAWDALRRHGVDPQRVDRESVERAIAEARGVPVDVGRLPPAATEENAARPRSYLRTPLLKIASARAAESAAAFSAASARRTAWSAALSAAAARPSTESSLRSAVSMRDSRVATRDSSALTLPRVAQPTGAARRSPARSRRGIGDE